MTAQHGLFGPLFDHGSAGVDDAAWLQAMLDTEAALARALERAGLASPGAGAAVTAAARAENFDIDEIGRQSVAAGNPVPALVRALTARVGNGAASAVHFGATSQDVIDTAVMLLARQVLASLEADLSAAAASSARLATDHARTVMAGRTLLQQAVPVTFGLLAAGWLTAVDDARSQLDRIATSRLAVQFGGAAGTLAVLGGSGPSVVTLLAEELHLAAPDLPWHTDRLRLLDLAAALTAACAAAGKIARDVSLLAETEIDEVREGKGGGSSAMPHKRNPVAAVLILGCSRRAPMLLGTIAAAAEQELQRAAGGWHAEWEPIADLMRITTSAAAWTSELLHGLQVDPGRMRANLDASRGLLMAEQVATRLIPSLGRVQAMELVAAASREAAGAGRDLADVLANDRQYAGPLAAAGIGAEEIAAATNPDGSLGATAEFIAAALAAHAEYELKVSR